MKDLSSGKTEVEKWTLSKTVSNHFFYCYPKYKVFYSFMGFLASVIWQYLDYNRLIDLIDLTIID